MPDTPQIMTLMAFCKDIGNCNINRETYYACANFLFYTSWFEEKLFTNKQGERQCPHTSSVIAAKLAPQLDLTEYDVYGDYFVQRYLDCPKAAEYRHALQLGDINKLQTVLQEYRDNKTRNSELLWTYLMIAYRFRNNMFHGSKGLINLNTYKDQFELLNRFWDQLLRDIDRVGYQGFRTQSK